MYQIFSVSIKDLHYYAFPWFLRLKSIRCRPDINEGQVLHLECGHSERCGFKGCHKRRNKHRCGLCNRSFCKKHIGFHFQKNKKYRWGSFTDEWIAVEMILWLQLLHLNEDRFFVKFVASLIYWIFFFCRSFQLAQNEITKIKDDILVAEIQS